MGQQHGFKWKTITKMVL